MIKLNVPYFCNFLSVIWSYNCIEKLLGIILLLFIGCEKKLENSEAANYITDDLYKRIDIEISPKPVPTWAKKFKKLSEVINSIIVPPHK